RLKGTVRNVTDFGVFVAIRDGVDGLVHASDLSWTERVQPAERYKPGDEVEVVLLDIDVANERVSLGIKQLTQDPWLEAVKERPQGTTFKSKITRVTDFGVFVEVAP